MNKRDYDKRVAKCLCPKCGKPVTQGICCAECRGKALSVKQSMQAQGLCPHCGATVTDGYVYCHKSREGFAARYRDRKAKGLCPKCSQPSEGYVYCEECRDYFAAAYHRGRKA